ncbi:hypothetical protein NDU88_005241 [Pleurodeles waltl]|uniref:Uncharacterized protein n=1 Tax=Pleurodeles waltl TaxID=8319 RepID=A0AAV7TU70_PLEWA|nr:hypothetical protein NDU88_005241 [Pleurodeles waltl]
MEEEQTVEQQDDLDRMLAQMMAEALKRGKDWLRVKMLEKGDERQTPDLADQICLPLAEDTNDAGTITRSPQNASKRQRTEEKPAKKAAKWSRGMDQSTTAPPTREPPESSSLCTPAEGEHISAIIKECLNLFAPLLLKGSSAGLSIECAGKGESQGNPNKGERSGTHAGRNEQITPGDPTPAWGIAGKVIDPPMSVGNPSETYARPSLGPPAMTTRAAGLANAIPLTVKERIWRKEFIDIFSLLEIQLERLDLTICDKKEEDRRERKRARKERNFENWLDAFRIMACLLVQKYPRCAVDLWLYES